MATFLSSLASTGFFLMPTVASTDREEAFLEDPASTATLPPRIGQCVAMCRLQAGVAVAMFFVVAVRVMVTVKAIVAVGRLVWSISTRTGWRTCCSLGSWAGLRAGLWAGYWTGRWTRKRGGGFPRLAACTDHGEGWW